MSINHQFISNQTVRRHRRPGARNGAVLVEMAFIIPVMMMTLIIAMDLSRFLIVTMSLNNALNQGIVAGSNTALNVGSTSSWVGAIEGAIHDSLAQYPWFQASDLQVTSPVPSTQNGLIDASGFRSIKVTITYHSRFLFPWPGLASNYQLNLTMQSDQIR